MPQVQKSQISFKGMDIPVYLYVNGFTPDEITIDHQGNPVFHYSESQALNNALGEYYAGIADVKRSSLIQAYRKLQRLISDISNSDCKR